LVAFYFNRSKALALNVLAQTSDGLNPFR
jgi:hypothetical protein